MKTINNPLLSGKRVGKFEAIPFNDFKFEHYEPAFDVALEEAKKDIDVIRNNPDEPTFENVIEALENAGPTLDYVSTVYFNLVGAESNNEFKDLAQKIGPKLSAFSNSIMMDPVIFAKVKVVFDKKDNCDLSKEQIRLLEKNYKGFVRNGALLSEEKKEELKKIDEEMSKLNPQFAKNTLGATNAFELLITDESELDGLPQGAKDAAAFTAKRKEKEGWMFTLQAPSVMPVFKYSKNRNLREKIYKAYSSRSFNDKFDNQEILKRIAVLRFKRANILGYKTHAEYVLEERMAEKPETVHNFLQKIYDVAMPVAKEELAEVKALAKELDGIENFMPWDSSFYNEKLRQKKYEFDGEELRPYFQAENVLQGAFDVANKMYDINFTPISDIPVYHKDVKTFEVTGKDNEHIGLFYVDLFPRETKRGGAWMTEFRTQGMDQGKMKSPHAAIVCNFSPATDKTPALLQISEVQTLFHEFGHALHGLLSDCHYKSLASPNVYWDFVELPSQIMENWVMEKEALNLFAKHYQTGEALPDELIAKVKRAENFNKGSLNVRQLSLGTIDLSWHDADPTNIDDVAAHENKIMEKFRLLPNVETSLTSTSFGHIFAGGYSAGYYSYKWAEVLDADAFDKFKKDGIFNKETADSFRRNILSKGNTAHPMELFVNFRGQQPDPDALLRRDGLLK